MGQNFAGFGGSLRYIETSGTFGALSRPCSTAGVIGSLSARSKYIAGYDGTPVPVNSRYFEGGDTFRGFSIAGIGPRDLSQGQLGAVGGNVSAIGTLAARLPALLPESFGVKLSLFSDFGTVGHLDSIRQLRAVPARHTAQHPAACMQDNLAFAPRRRFGVQWQSPFGPLNIDLGIPFVKTSYDSPNKSYISAQVQDSDR